MAGELSQRLLVAYVLHDTIVQTDYAHDRSQHVGTDLRNEPKSGLRKELWVATDAHAAPTGIIKATSSIASDSIEIQQSTILSFQIRTAVLHETSATRDSPYSCSADP